MKNGIKILIDTDIGDDIDDAFALGMAIQLGYDIVGVTTVFLNTDHRARLAKKILHSAGGKYKHVPVFAGHANPIDEKREDYPMCQYTDDLEREEYAPDSNDPEAAVDFIIDCCKKYGENLYVIAIGPFTNIAKALQKSPQVFDGIGKFVIMGGAYYKQYVDWNMLCDIAAGDIMFRGTANIEAVGADVTHQLVLSDSERQKIIEYSGDNETVSLISGLYRSWWGHSIPGRTALHDPLAIYYALYPEICGCERQRIVVITEGYGRGMTLNVDAYGKKDYNPAFKDADITKSATVAKNVKAREFIDIFMNLFD